MHLDKTKLRELIDKTKDLEVSLKQNDFNTNNILIQQLGKSLSILSTWLGKHPNLANGSTYGKKLAELKNRLPTNQGKQFGS